MFYVCFASLALAAAGAVYYKQRIDFKTILKMSSFILSSRSKAEPIEARHVNGNVYAVTYLHDGRQYELFFPIRLDTKDMFMNKEVYASLKYGFVSLAQQVGVPYFIKGNDFEEPCGILVIDNLHDKKYYFTSDEDVILTPSKKEE